MLHPPVLLAKKLAQVVSTQIKRELTRNVNQKNKAAWVNSKQFLSTELHFWYHDKGGDVDEVGDEKREQERLTERQCPVLC